MENEQAQDLGALAAEVRRMMETPHSAAEQAISPILGGLLAAVESQAAEIKLLQAAVSKAAELGQRTMLQRLVGG